MRRLGTTLLVAAVMGCGGDSSRDGGGGGSDGTTTVRCLWVDDLCDQINAVMTAQQQADLDASCTTDGGSPAVGTCPTTGAVAGHCLYTGEVVTLWTGVAIPGATLIDFHYSAAGWTSGIAEIWCGSYPEGTWVP